MVTRAPQPRRDFEAYLAQRPPAVRALAEDVVALVLAEVPNAEARMNYGCPFFYLGGVPFAYVSASRGRVLLGFVRGADIDDPTGRLRGTGRSSIRRAELPAGEPVPRTAANAWLRQAARLAAAEAAASER